ncbi:MAG: Uma2 family endonuclease [Methylococcales bacterium]|nr:Uma2 family endonuclease [Methylococcales bacterium]
MSTAENLQHKYTYADYAQWSGDERWELIDGAAYAMTGPLRIHQEVVSELGRQIGNFLQGKPCRVYVAPFDVRMPREDEDDSKVETVVQPDLSIICDKSKLDKLGCRGAPDWIVEVLSPSTALKDMNTKRSLYEQHGVQEYWIIHAEDRWLMVYTLDAQKKYGQPGVFGMDEPTAVQRLPDLSIDWSFMIEI